MTSPKDNALHLDMSFEEAIARIAQTDPAELPTSPLDSVADGIEDLIDQFENAGHDNGHGDKWWYARELQTLLGYKRWESFEDVIDKAVTACQQAGHDPDDHFRRVAKMITLAKGAERDIGDVMLDRYACYLAAQNASSRLKQVAFAQTYFAIQTRRQELHDRDGVDFDKLSENQKRLYLRNQVVAENKRLASAARAAGVTTGPDFGKFQNKGYQGLYGGRGVSEIKVYKRLPGKANILDHMGSTELAANLFRITQTEEKLRNGAIVGKEAACDAHYEVGVKVRQTMKELSGIMPEDLPVAEDVKKIAAQERKQQRVRAIAPEVRIAQPLAGPNLNDPVEIDLRRDLWKYALLIMSVCPNGEISTSDLIERIPGYVRLSGEQMSANASRKDSKFSQIVRNLKSHKSTKTNFIFQGFADDIRGGFKITPKGMAFIREYFAN